MFVSWRLRILFMRNLHCLFCTPSPQTGDISIIGLSKVLEKAPDTALIRFQAEPKRMTFRHILLQQHF